MNKIKVHIIARLESKRVLRKNLRMLNGKPMILYAIEAAKESKLINNADIYINTENDILGQLALNNGIKYFKRDEALAEDDVVLDQTTYAFINYVDCDIVGMVNPVCPLTTGEDIDNGLKYFLENDFDTLLTVREEYLHAFMDGNPLNIELNKKIPITQKLSPIQIVTWNFCFWKTEVFRKNYEEKGFGVFSGKIGLFAIDKLKAIKISEESDFQMAEALLRAREAPTHIEYYNIPDFK